MSIIHVGRLLICNREPKVDKLLKKVSVSESVSIKYLLICTNAETNLIYKNKYK